MGQYQLNILSKQTNTYLIKFLIVKKKIIKL